MYIKNGAILCISDTQTRPQLSGITIAESWVDTKEQHAHTFYFFLLIYISIFVCIQLHIPIPHLLGISEKKM